MERTRSEYRLRPIRLANSVDTLSTVRPGEQHRDRLAALMLDAYRGTVDDEGETFDDALDAVDQSLGLILRSHSHVVLDGAEVVAYVGVVVVADVHYIDPVVVSSANKRKGLGTSLVCRCLASLAGDGVTEVGATITDGNVASEALFTGLGFHRVGPWG